MVGQLDAGPAGNRLLDQGQIGRQIVELLGQPLFATLIGRFGGDKAQ